MENPWCISSYCVVRKQKISRNGSVIFSGLQSATGSFLSEAYKHFNLNYPKFYKMDNLCKLGFMASELLIEGSDIQNKYKGEDTGIILYNAASSIDTDRTHQSSIQDRNAYFPSPSVFVYTLANIVIGEICIRNKFQGESAFFVSEKFDPVALFEYVRILLDQQIVKCCITGWMESDGDHYDAALYLIEKSDTKTRGFAIFEPENILNLYLQGN
jgi:hypothetical protein